MRVHTSIVMPDGFHYLQKCFVRGVETIVRIDGSSFEELLANVQDWRIHNKVDVGDVLGDVTSQICQRFPRQCTGEGLPDVVSSVGGPVFNSNAGTKLTDLILNWMREISFKPDVKKIEAQHEADRRSVICKQCKENVVYENACPVCVEHIRRAGTLLRLNKQSANHEDLHACRILKHDNATAVFINKGVLPKAEGLPNQCWNKP